VWIHCSSLVACANSSIRCWSTVSQSPGPNTAPTSRSVILMARIVVEEREPQ
jgi:hypothetical protein